MLKFIFWILLLANGALYAYHQGHLESFFSASREPARLVKQINADQIKLISVVEKLSTNTAEPSVTVDSALVPKPQEAVDMADAANAKPEPTEVVTADLPLSSAAVTLPTSAITNSTIVSSANFDTEKSDSVKKSEDAVKNATAGQKIDADKKPAVLVCLEIGNFNEADAVRVAARLEALVPTARLSRRVIREVSSHMVFMPPQGSKENADRKVDQLRSLGVTDFYVIQEQTDMRWGISLGIFSSEEAAKKRLAQLQQQGVRTARVGVRNSLSKVAFQLRELDAASRNKLNALKVDFPQQQQRSCN